MSEVKIVADIWSLQELKPIEFPRLQVHFTKKRMEEKEKSYVIKWMGLKTISKLQIRGIFFFETKHICTVTTESEWCRAITK